MLCKVDVPFTRTRGSGVFNEKFPVEFRTGTLLVVGIAADRRQIIAQARQKRMNVIVVDPCMKVSHGVQHLNYLRATDRFYRCTADTFFRELSSLTKEVAHG
jgi:DNA-binding NarL/FixJ family response regulator